MVVSAERKLQLHLPPSLSLSVSRDTVTQQRQSVTSRIITYLSFTFHIFRSDEQIHYMHPIRAYFCPPIGATYAYWILLGQHIFDTTVNVNRFHSCMNFLDRFNVFSYRYSSYYSFLMMLG